MVSLEQALAWRSRPLHGPDGDRIGTIEEIYLDAESNQPEWALVNTGLFGTKSSFVPLRGAAPTGEDVRVEYTKDQVKDAPSVDADGELSHREESELYRHYGLEYSEYSDVGDQTGMAEGTTTARGGRADAEDAMTRSEEELRVGTAERERGRVRLKKWVETEDVQESVPVRREEARVEREPISDDNVDQALSGPEISEAEHEVTLREEEPVVEKRAVPKERVRLDKDVETGEEQVSEEVRKERIDVDDDR
jgi:uncharacterized protein (TIGR02271 family)